MKKINLNKNILLLIPLILFSLQLSAQNQKQALIQGKITDADNIGLPGVNILLNNGEYGTTTNEDGEYQLSVPAGKYQIAITHIQYKLNSRDIILSPGETLVLSLSMEESSYSLDDVTITASATPTSLRKLASSVSIIKSTAPEMQQIQTADDALNFVPGVYVRRMRGLSTTGGHTTVTMRGTGAANRTLILKDGIPINDAYTGGVQEWNTIATNSIARMEVVRGPGSSLYGTNSMGGTINIVTETPKSKPTLGAELRYGSMNTLIAGAKAGKKFDNGFGVIAFAEYKKTDGYQYLTDSLWNDYYQKPDIELLNVNTKLSYQFNSDSKIEAIVDFHQQKPSTGTSTIYSENYITDNYLLRYTAQDKLFSYNLSAYYNHQHRETNAIRWNQEDEAFNTNYYDSEVPIGVYGFFGKVSKEFQSNTLTVGADIRLAEVNSKKFYYGSGDQKFSGNQNFVSFFINDEASLGDRVNLNLGLRYDSWQNVNGSFYDNQSEEDISIDYDKASSNVLSPKLGLVYHLTDQVRLRTSYAMGFKAPNMYYMYNATPLGSSFRLGNPDLKPERMTYSVDFGADYYLNDQLEISATYFTSSFKEFLDNVLIDEDKVPSYFDPGGLPVRQYINIGEVHLSGLEASVRYNFLPHTTAIISYFYNKSEILKYETNSEYEGNQLDDNPNHLLNAGLSFDHPRIINASLWVRHTGRYFADVENSDDMIIDPTTVVDFKVSKKLGKFVVTANVLNVFDLEYYGSYSSPTSYYYAQPRAVNLGLTFNL